MKNQRFASGVNLRKADEAEETLRAIRQGAVDAFVVEDAEGQRVYTLEGSDLPYSVLAERMQQGAAMLNDRSEIIYCNLSLAQLLGRPREAVIGLTLQELVSQDDHSSCHELLSETQFGTREAELRLRRVDGSLMPAKFAVCALSRDKSATGVLITDLTAQKQLEELAFRLQRMQDEERRRIARELHDSVGQMLAAISMNIATVKTEVDKLSPEVGKLVYENEGIIKQIGEEIRTISHLLHPPLLDEVGLPSALRWYTDGFSHRSKIQTSLEVPEQIDRLPQEMEIAIFRAVQECLTNVHRHSGSVSCSVKIVPGADHLRVEIKDQGCGIPQERLATLSSSGGLGFRGMRERLRRLGGSLDVQSDNTGTTVIATLPVPPKEKSSENAA
jgi:PAS domain S-box-containing protein